MKNILNHCLVISALLFAVSCKKTNDTAPLPEPVNPAEIDKTEKLTWKFDSFIVDDNHVAQIFPGAIFSVKQSANDLEMVSLKDKYTPLPITASTSLVGVINQSFNDVPSADKIATYIKSLTTKNSDASQAYSEDEFKDYNVVKYYLSNNDDVKSIFEKIGITTSTRITKKHASYFFSNNIKFSLDMNLPKKTELLSIADADAISTSNNAYYINGVSYGNNTLILAEADADYATLKVALKAVLLKQDLTSAQIQVLNTAKVVFYARGGNEKSFIKIAKNLDEIKAITKEFETFNNTAISYPVSYSLRSVKDFTLFKHEITVNIIK
ncbi:thiol-activated cytolysin family protein [Pedobacter jeongneungensis]|uniref:thiol-activated cytolysin family protein n=1 Tax=Pedobacter jeongneungensis TaxID=947309 RepID=UPI0004681A67|nr:thiol-activated cytolysin family protein [Pedobacter jeongneungensis]